MLALRPFERDRAVFEAAERLWWSLPEEEWLAAFAAHPRLGESGVEEGWSRAEQAGAAGADPAVQAALAAGNREYEGRFGFVFLLCATGLDAGEMLTSLRRRLSNERAEELEVAAGEQARITRLRLEKLGAESVTGGGALSGPHHHDDRAAHQTPAGEPGKEGRPVGITTHVLDTANGRPAVGVRVTLERAGPGREWTTIFAGTTDGDGRVANMLEAGGGEPGVYRLRFDTGSYFERAGVTAFHPHAEVTFRVDAPEEHHHVPLLASPFGFTTYRGS